jgi:hypothetical protein
MTLSWQKRCRSAVGIQPVATRSRTILTCDQRPRQMLFTLRLIVLFSSSIAASPCVCGPVTSVPRRRARGTGRDAGLRCRRSWCRAAAMQASRNCRRPPVRRRYWHASPRKNCPNIWASSFTLDYRRKQRAAGRVAEYVRQRVLATHPYSLGAFESTAPARGRRESGRCGKSGSGQKRQSRIVVDKSASPVTADLSEPPTDFALAPTTDIPATACRRLAVEHS